MTLVKLAEKYFKNEIGDDQVIELSKNIKIFKPDRGLYSDEYPSIADGNSWFEVETEFWDYDLDKFYKFVELVSLGQKKK